MTAEQLLLDLQRKGLRAEARAGELVVSPANRITADLRERIKKHRKALLKLLREDDPVQTERLTRSAHKLWSRPVPDWKRPGYQGPVDADLAAWFASAREAGRLPSVPWELAPAVTVTDPERLYGWIGRVLARGETGAEAREAEGYLRHLFGACGGWDGLTRPLAPATLQTVPEEPSAPTGVSRSHTVHAVSMWQPWASILAAGIKKVETRSWPVEVRLPAVVAIHATKVGTRANEEVIDEACKTLAGPLRQAGYVRSIDLPRGAIVGLGLLVQCERTEDLPADGLERQLGDHTPGRWGWVFGDVLKLPTPIPCRGAQKLWQWVAPVELADWIEQHQG